MSGLAKGTFYLYFKDKYNIRDVLIQQESEHLFKNALDELNKMIFETLMMQLYMSSIMY